jgi:hypothetical protein
VYFSTQTGNWTIQFPNNLALSGPTYQVDATDDQGQNAAPVTGVRIVQFIH